MATTKVEGVAAFTADGATFLSDLITFYQNIVGFIPQGVEAELKFEANKMTVRWPVLDV